MESRREGRRAERRESTAGGRAGEQEGEQEEWQQSRAFNQKGREWEGRRQNRRGGMKKDSMLEGKRRIGMLGSNQARSAEGNNVGKQLSRK